MQDHGTRRRERSRYLSAGNARGNILGEKTMKKNIEGAAVVGAACLALLLPGLSGCGKDNPVAPTTSPYVKASDWIANANWAQAPTITMETVETSPTQMSFEPDTLTFEAGKPYVLRIRSRAGNLEKHYFAPEGSTDFFRAIAPRKVQTSQAEYKAAYFKAVEVNPGKQLDLYFVPVLSGTYDFLCTIAGHRDYGMKGKIFITGGTGYRLDQEVDPAFNPALATDARTSGSHAVWSTRVDLGVQMVESGGGYAYNPATLNMKRDSAYVITLSNPAANVEKHYYTAAAFFRSVVTRKFEDADAEIKAPYFNAVELLLGASGTSAKLFVVPTVADTFEVHCTIPGHTAGGMEGSLIVGN